MKVVTPELTRARAAVTHAKTLESERTKKLSTSKLDDLNGSIQAKPATEGQAMSKTSADDSKPILDDKKHKNDVPPTP